jgi:response regulator RpfG family c-di-GMP phosphodiesterase
MKIRTKIILIVLPLLFMSLIITTALSTFNARSGMTRIAMKSLGFKTEELKKYAENQWDLVVTNNLSDNPNYISAAKNAVKSYAGSIIRDDTELIFAVHQDGSILMSTTELMLSESERNYLADRLLGEQSGWIETSVGREIRVGYFFFFEPFNWFVFVTESRKAFYREVREILIQNGIILIVTSSILIILLLPFSHYIARPLVRVVNAMKRMVKENDFSHRVMVEYADEIGHLAHQFNIMSIDLEDAYQQVREFALKEFLSRKKVSDRERETLTVLGRAAEYKYPESRVHIQRVALYARLLTKALGSDEKEQLLIHLAAPLHDIGNMGIVDTILLNRGDLTDEEFEILKTHTQIAYDILHNSESPYLQAGASIALTHHERYDGSGYPNALQGDEIPLYGRIVGLVDVFDVMTSHRPYREAYSFPDAAEFIRSNRGILFDPELVDLFFTHIDEVRMIFETHREEYSFRNA